jgi:hypothetical protein
MANYRIPGPICGENQNWEIDDGTLARTQSPLAGPVCAESSNYPTKALSSSPIDASEPDFQFLFRQCSNPETGLSEADYKDAATALGAEIAAIMAVAEVETSGNAFDDSGRPRILFERHKFSEFTFGKYDTTYPDISNPVAGGYGKFSAQYEKLERAYNLDPDAALRSASWGRFQIMGQYFEMAGFPSVREFVLAMTKSESEHLKAFVNFVKNKKTAFTPLGKKDWAGFALAYNGKSYKKNDYDTKLKDAYEGYKKREAGAIPGKL